MSEFAFQPFQLRHCCNNSVDCFIHLKKQSDFDGNRWWICKSHGRVAHRKKQIRSEMIYNGIVRIHYIIRLVRDGCCRIGFRGRCGFNPVKSSSKWDFMGDHTLHHPRQRPIYHSPALSFSLSFSLLSHFLSLLLLIDSKSNASSPFNIVSNSSNNSRNWFSNLRRIYIYIYKMYKWIIYKYIR